MKALNNLPTLLQHHYQRITNNPLEHLQAKKYLSLRQFKVKQLVIRVKEIRLRRHKKHQLLQRLLRHHQLKEGLHIQQQEITSVRQRVSSQHLETAKSFTVVLTMGKARLQNMTSFAGKVLSGIQPIMSVITHLPSKETAMSEVNLGMWIKYLADRKTLPGGAEAIQPH
jgi:hypothetical protein